MVGTSVGFRFFRFFEAHEWILQMERRFASFLEVIRCQRLEGFWCAGVKGIFVNRFGTDVKRTYER